MKTITILFFAAASAFGQPAVFTQAGWTFPGLGGNASIPVVQTYDQSVALWNNFFLTQQLSGVAPTAITSSVTSTATSIPLASITGLSVGNGVCVSPNPTSCASTATTTGTGPYTFSASTVEVMQITAITPGTPPAGTVTVMRAGISPTGAGSAYSSGQVVTFTVLPNLTYYALSFYVNARAQITANPANGAATAVAAAAAIAAQNAANNASSNTH